MKFLEKKKRLVEYIPKRKSKKCPTGGGVKL